LYFLYAQLGFIRLALLGKHLRRRIGMTERLPQLLPEQANDT